MAGQEARERLGRARNHQADAGESAAGIAAVKIALDHPLDNQPEEAVLILKAALIHSQEAFEIVKEDAIEDSPLGVTGTIDSRHRRKNDAINRE